MRRVRGWLRVSAGYYVSGACHIIRDRRRNRPWVLRGPGIGPQGLRFESLRAAQQAADAGSPA